MTALLAAVVFILAVVVLVQACVIRDHRHELNAAYEATRPPLVPADLGQWCTCNPHHCTLAEGRLDGCSTSCRLCAPVSNEDVF